LPITLQGSHPQGFRFPFNQPANFFGPNRKLNLFRRQIRYLSSIYILEKQFSFQKEPDAFLNCIFTCPEKCTRAVAFSHLEKQNKLFVSFLLFKIMQQQRAEMLQFKERSFLGSWNSRSGGILYTQKILRTHMRTKNTCFSDADRGAICWF
jgi:hypothetical protein